MKIMQMYIMYCLFFFVIYIYIETKGTDSFRASFWTQGKRHDLL